MPHSTLFGKYFSAALLIAVCLSACAVNPSLIPEEARYDEKGREIEKAYYVPGSLISGVCEGLIEGTLEGAGQGGAFAPITAIIGGTIAAGQALTNPRTEGTIIYKYKKREYPEYLEAEE
jgi:hypothetical protein